LGVLEELGPSDLAEQRKDVSQKSAPLSLQPRQLDAQSNFLRFGWN
jgi:hypothetical protein